MNISELQTILREIGYSDARALMKSLVSGVESSLTDIRMTRMEIDDALHALAVLAGNYDDSVRDGRQTYSVGGVMPQLTAAAHDIRRGAL